MRFRGPAHLKCAFLLALGGVLGLLVVVRVQPAFGWAMFHCYQVASEAPDGRVRDSTDGGAVHPSAPEPTGEWLKADRVFEDVQLAVRLTKRKLQFYALEGQSVTQWYQAELPVDQSRSLWRKVEEAGLDSLKEEYRPTPSAPGEPPLLRETDELVVRIQGREGERTIRVLYRPEGPAELTRLIETLEQTAVRRGNPQAGAERALLAKDLDVRNYPREETLAATLTRGGARFFEPADAWLHSNRRVLEALNAPGWLVPAKEGDLPAEPALPAYFRTSGHRHLQVMDFRVELVETPNSD